MEAELNALRRARYTVSRWTSTRKGACNPQLLRLDEPNLEIRA